MLPTPGSISKDFFLSLLISEKFIVSTKKSPLKSDLSTERQFDVLEVNKKIFTDNVFVPLSQSILF